MSGDRAGYLAALAASVGLGLAIALARMAYDGGTDPQSIVASRALFVVLLLAAVALATGRRLALPRRAQLHCLGLGLLLAHMFFGNVGAVRYVPVGLAALLFFTYPPQVAVLSAILDRRLPRPLEVVAIAAAFLGLALMLGAGVEGDADWRGIVLSLTAAAACAANAVWLARALPGADPIATTFHMASVAAVIIVALTLATGGVTVPTGTAGWIGAAGVVVLQGSAILGYFVAIRRIGASRTAMINNLQPVVSVLAAWALYGESLGAAEWAGGALVLGGIAVMQWDGARRGGRAPS